MPDEFPRRSAWVVLTTGDRPTELRACVESIRASADPHPVSVTVVGNGCDPSAQLADLEYVEVVPSTHNLGIPAARDLALRRSTSEIVCFLDDDARLVSSGLPDRVEQLFADDPGLAVVSFRIADESGQTTRRHVPRPGRSSHERAGRVATFLGGACALRRSAYVAAGGYWGELFYGHEELELAWRLTEAGSAIVYEPTLEVFHPAAPIGRHQRGWWMTGRNRVWVARRSLPLPIAAAHVLIWLVIGTWRAPTRACRSGYLSGWRAGWREPVDRSPISWRAVALLTRLGRPPVI